MRLATFRKWNVERAGLVTKSGLLPLTALGLRAGFEPEGEILPLIEKEQLEPLTEWYNAGGKAEAEALAEKEAIPYGEVVYGPLYRNPQRIFGIGLNYKDHEKCKFIEEKDWLKYVAGYTTILDMTEESILRLNPRYLTIVKGFDTFFTFGPQLVTPDEVPDVSALEVATVHNGEVHAKNTVSNMTFSPSRLVALVSHMQGWLPGDILSTGTPRAVHIQDGDVAECRITGPDGFAFEPLVNPVIDLKIRNK